MHPKPLPDSVPSASGDTHWPVAVAQSECYVPWVMCELACSAPFAEGGELCLLSIHCRFEIRAGGCTSMGLRSRLFQFSPAHVPLKGTAKVTSLVCKLSAGAWQDAPPPCHALFPSPAQVSSGLGPGGLTFHGDVHGRDFGRFKLERQGKRRAPRAHGAVRWAASHRAQAGRTQETGETDVLQPMENAKRKGSVQWQSRRHEAGKVPETGPRGISVLTVQRHGKSAGTM